MQNNGKRMVPWTRKYSPKKVKEVVGQDAAVSALKKFLSEFKKQPKKSVIIYGPRGSGKTAVVYALANELNYEVVEVNASDFRNKDAIESIVGSAIKQQSLFSKGKIILVDEIDGLSGREDRGGISALSKLTAQTSFPLIMTANDPYLRKLSDLRKKCPLIEFNALDYVSITKILENICWKEGVKCDNDALKSLARRAGGDARAAINDLQGIVGEKKTFLKKDLESLDQREQKENIINALVRIFKTTDPKVAINALNNVDEDLDKAMLWIDENLPKEYKKPEDLARAYDFLSKADVMNRRIKRWQHWRFLVYINAYLTAGVAVSKDEKYKEFVSYGPTQRILKLWRAKMKHEKAKAIARKIADKTHASAKTAYKDILPYFKVIFEKNKKQAESMAEEFELDEDEVKWLRKST